MLTPYTETIGRLNDELEDARRRLKSMIRLGYVCEINETGTLIRVKHGDLTTPFISWFASSAGETIDYRCPSIGEQAVLVNFGAGDSPTQYKALIGLFSDKFPSPSNDPNEILRVYPDGTRVSYHAKNHHLKVDINGAADIHVEKDATVDVDGVASVKGKKIKLNEGCSVVTTGHKCHFTGKPHGDGSSTVTAGK
jgi:phage baseplate assembly protein V